MSSEIASITGCAVNKQSHQSRDESQLIPVVHHSQRRRRIHVRIYTRVSSVESQTRHRDIVSRIARTHDSPLSFSLSLSLSDERAKHSRCETGLQAVS